jgi:hypothetical protein
MAATPQRLVASTLTPDPADALAARTGDGLWFLARQWQTGEFEAENGGTPAEVHVTRRDHPLASIAWPKPAGGFGRAVALDRAEPLDRAVEAEGRRGDAPGWRAEALEYTARIDATGHKLTATSYDGRQLDWWHFDLSAVKTARTGAVTAAMVPTMLHFKGAPHPRWWRLEDGDADFDAPDDPEPNALSTILPELFLADLDNWYVLPLPCDAGTLREIVTLTVTDSFGVATTLGPASRETDGTAEWRLFALSGLEDSGRGQDGRFLFVPHVAGQVTDNDLVEDVRFLRDEDANLVWAVEMAYRRPDGTLVRNGDSASDAPAAASPTPADGTSGRFRLQTDTPAHWIPYVPRVERPQAQGTDGATFLRRGRTVEASTPRAPQYQGRIVAETVRLNEEEIATTGVRVRRMHRYARGTDGRAVHWTARVVEVTDRLSSGPGLRFDQVER